MGAEGLRFEVVEELLDLGDAFYRGIERIKEEGKQNRQSESIPA